MEISSIFYHNYVTFHQISSELLGVPFKLKFCFLPDLRKMVFGSSSTFSRVLRVPQNQREFIKIRAALGFVFIVICIISDQSFLIRLIKVTPLRCFINAASLKLVFFRPEPHYSFRVPN